MHEDIEPEELNKYLCEFILRVKRKDGKDFEPSSLRGLFSSFNRHLKKCKYPVSVIEDVAFERARRPLSTLDIERVGFVEKLGIYFFARKVSLVRFVKTNSCVNIVRQHRP